jgi:hypothetical protein
MRLRAAGELAAIMAAALLLAHAQSTCSKPEAAFPTIKATSTLVAVPALVRLPSGEFVKDLDAHQIELFDNGIRQKVNLEETGNRPLAVVVLMQASGPDAVQFRNYRKLPELLNTMVGQSVHEIMLVTFDSRPRATWHFPARSDGVEYALTHPAPGDELHAAFVTESRTRSRGMEPRTGNPGRRSLRGPKIRGFNCFFPAPVRICSSISKSYGA